MIRQNFIIVLVGLMLQTLPPCAERPGYLNNPWVNSESFCLELVIEDAGTGELAYTALAAAPDGTLYAARPLAGQVFAIEDTDGDSLPDTSRMIADGLTLPNGLAVDGDTLYISGGEHIYRWQNDVLETLVDDVPAGGGFWTGDVTLGNDGRLYVVTGGAAGDDPLRGAVLSYAADGSDRQTVITGLQTPTGIAFHAGVLWTTDSARDTLNRMDAAAITFPAGSQPSMLLSYTGDGLLQDALIVVLRGTSDQVELEGFAVVVVPFDAEGQPAGYEVIVPQESRTPTYKGFTLRELNYRTSGFWPHHPIDTAASPEGWLYISVGGGRILVLRPQ